MALQDDVNSAYKTNTLNSTSMASKVISNINAEKEDPWFMLKCANGNDVTEDIWQAICSAITSIITDWYNEKDTGTKNADTKIINALNALTTRVTNLENKFNNWSTSKTQ